MHAVDLPLVYQNYGLPPRARKEQHFYVMGSVSVRFDDHASNEALRYVHVGQNPGGSSHVTPLHIAKGMLVRSAWSPARYGQIDVAALAALRPADVPETLRPGNTRRAYSSCSNRIYSEGEINPAKVTYNGKEQAESEVRAAADSSFTIIDGTLYSRAVDPCWRLNPFGPSPEIEAILGGHRSLWLPADCVKEKDEFAQWSAARGLPMGSNPHHFEILATDIPYQTNPIVEMAMEIARRTEPNIVDYAPFGHEVRTAAISLLSCRTTTDALDFMHSLDDPARHEAAKSLMPYAPDRNGDLIDAFWKAYELLPAGYKCDPEDEILLPSISP